jgi:hypothetical protein
VQARVTSETVTPISNNRLLTVSRVFHRTPCVRELEATIRVQREPKKTRTFEPAAQEQYRLPHKIELATNRTRMRENQDLGQWLLNRKSTMETSAWHL